MVKLVVNVLRTRFTDLTGCKVPIQQAAIGGLARPQLATAVLEAGGLGMVYAGSFDPKQMTTVFEDMRRHTSGVFGANFLIPEAFVSDLNEIHEQVETAAKLVKVVEFFYRQPDASLVDLVHKGGALASWQVGSNEEAVAAAEAGCDMIVAQGIEAGGDGRGEGSLLTLVRQVFDSFKGDIVGHKKLISTGEMVPVKPLESFTMTSETTGNIKAMPHWAGESVSGVKNIKPVAAIIKELVDEAETLLHKWH